MAGALGDRSQAWPGPGHWTWTQASNHTFPAPSHRLPEEPHLKAMRIRACTSHAGPSAAAAFDHKTERGPRDGQSGGASGATGSPASPAPSSPRVASLEHGVRARLEAAAHFGNAQFGQDGAGGAGVVVAGPVEGGGGVLAEVLGQDGLASRVLIKEFADVVHPILDDDEGLPIPDGLLYFLHRHRWRCLRRLSAAVAPRVPGARADDARHLRHEREAVALGRLPGHLHLRHIHLPGLVVLPALQRMHDGPHMARVEHPSVQVRRAVAETLNAVGVDTQAPNVEVRDVCAHELRGREAEIEHEAALGGMGLVLRAEPLPHQPRGAVAALSHGAALHEVVRRLALRIRCLHLGLHLKEPFL
mmetsp:Transcript_62747/g.103524  ORF Transcript_62747/g.103524 Transcript_62747/m.103524 type:complete len:360 (-) Transcript_62747:1552-2631(-)